MGKAYLVVLIFTFGSGFGGIGYRDFASKLSWPLGRSWGTPKADILCLAAMIIAAGEAWGEYGFKVALAVAIVGSLSAFVLAILIKHRVQLVYLTGITAGSALSLLGAFK